MVFGGAYGSTETVSSVFSTISSSSNIKSLFEFDPPNPGRCVYIVNKDCLCPAGIVGELLIGGEILSDGYINTTNDRFKVNSFGPGRVYHTGDIAR